MSVLYHFFVCKTILNTKGLSPLCHDSAGDDLRAEFSKYMILYIIEFLKDTMGTVPHCVIGGITK